MEKVNERKIIRNELLEELYDHYFMNWGNGKQILPSQMQDEHKEKYFAIKYLVSKQLVFEKHVGGNNYEYTISVYGIDMVESGKMF